MKESLEIVIYKNGMKLCHPSDNSITTFLVKEEGEVTEKIAAFIKKVSAAKNVIHLFVAEDLLFFKSFTIPLETVDLKEAVGYQMEILTPFADESTWHSFESVREEETYRVTLFAARSQFIDVYVQELIDAGYQVSGLYPESQRYVNKMNRKDAWGLLLPGHYIKAYVFNGPELKDRLLCSATPLFPEAVEVCCSDTIFRFDKETENSSLAAAEFSGVKPYFDFLDARFLLRQRPSLKSYNMLPATYQRPDYSKIIIAVLLVLNIVTFLGLGAVKAYRLKTLDDRVNQEIEQIMPLVNEVKVLRRKEEENLHALTRLKDVGVNFDFISFLQSLTADLPDSSYIDQIRMDKKNNSVHIQGYTDDINALTTNLQNVGDAQLKSTSRRKNKTYFHVELNLHE